MEKLVKCGRSSLGFNDKGEFEIRYEDAIGNMCALNLSLSGDEYNAIEEMFEKWLADGLPSEPTSKFNDWSISIFKAGKNSVILIYFDQPPINGIFTLCGLNRKVAANLLELFRGESVLERANDNQA